MSSLNVACRSRRSKLVDKQQSSSNVLVKTKELSPESTPSYRQKNAMLRTAKRTGAQYHRLEEDRESKTTSPILPEALNHRLHITTTIPNKNRSPRGLRPYLDRLLNRKLNANQTAYSKSQFKSDRIVEYHILAICLLLVMHLPLVRPPTNQPPTSPVDEGHRRDWNNLPTHEVENGPCFNVNDFLYRGC